jgi:hypothetical protein
MVGYFQTISWFCVKPCDDTSSFSWRLHISAVTWEFVSISFNKEPVCVFQKQMRLSAVPPPEASRC